MGDGADDAERAAFRELEEEGIIDAEPSRELVPAAATSLTLFRTDDPVEIISRATEIADALSDVLRKKNLTKRIGPKDYVQVEGWTLCGSMLGVYPVVEWTRPVEGGWEARVEARTRDGATVGAAEAECLRTETRWAKADDYSIRSMAQTRAISKALRAPLGFIVALAGYEATPEEEMVRPDASPVEPSAPKPFDPATDLLPGAIPGSAEAPKLLAAALDGIDPTVDWQAFLSLVTKLQYEKDSWRELDDASDFWRRLSNAVRWFDDHTPAGDFPPPDESMIVGAFVFGFDGDVAKLIPLPRKEIKDAPDGAVLTETETALIDAALNNPADDVGFGYENPNN